MSGEKSRMSVSAVVEPSWDNALFRQIEIGSVRLGINSVRHRTYGGTVKMSVIQNEGAFAPIESGWKPGQIYEFCVIEGEYKQTLIRSLRCAYPRHLFISDQEFQDIESVRRYLDSLSTLSDVLIIDISEVLYLGFIKDSEGLRGAIKAFYECLGRLCKAGVKCIVFVNSLIYPQIYQRITRPDFVRIINVSDMRSCQSQIYPLNGELPHFL
jgi:hypothetical protein